jgi:hypothetical protein
MIILSSTALSHPKKLMQVIYWSYQEVIGYKVIIRLDRMIHQIIQGEIDDPTGLPGQAGQRQTSESCIILLGCALSIREK